MFFILRSACWIVALSYLLNGGMLPREAPIPHSAYQSAAQVMKAVASLDGFCLKHAATCAAASDAAHFAKRQIAAAAKQASALIDEDGI